MQFLFASVLDMRLFLSHSVVIIIRQLFLNITSDVKKLEEVPLSSVNDATFIYFYFKEKLKNLDKFKRYLARISVTRNWLNLSELHALWRCSGLVLRC